MVRELRYWVLKIRDIEEYLSPLERQSLLEISLKIASARADEGRAPLVECVVIEKDWPEYEAVWKMLEDRVDGKKQHVWECISIGMYDSFYQCTKCGLQHTESMDAFASSPYGPRPLTGCGA